MSRRLERAAIPALAAGALAAVLAVLRLDGALLARLPRAVSYCWLREVTGVPCPFCGGTRALLALASGDLAASLAWNPLVAAAAVGLLASPLFALLLPDAPSSRAKRLARPALLRGLLALNWCYLLWSCLIARRLG